MTTPKKALPISYQGRDISVSLLQDFNDRRTLAFKSILNLEVKGLLVICPKSRRQFNYLFQSYPYEDVLETIEKMFLDDFHQKNVFKYLTLEFCSRPDKFERFYIQPVRTTKIVNRTSGLVNPYLQ